MRCHPACWWWESDNSIILPSYLSYLVPSSLSAIWVGIAELASLSRLCSFPSWFALQDWGLEYSHSTTFLGVSVSYSCYFGVLCSYSLFAHLKIFLIVASVQTGNYIVWIFVLNFISSHLILSHLCNSVCRITSPSIHSSALWDWDNSGGDCWWLGWWNAGRWI